MDLEESATQVIQSMGFIRHPTKLGYWVEPYREVTIRHRNLLRWARESADLNKRIIDEVGRLLGKRAHDGRHYRRNIDVAEKWKPRIWSVEAPGSFLRFDFDNFQQACSAIMEFFSDGWGKVHLETPTHNRYELDWTQIETLPPTHPGPVVYTVISPKRSHPFITSNVFQADVVAIRWFLKFGAPIYYTSSDEGGIYKYVLTGGQI